MKQGILDIDEMKDSTMKEKKAKKITVISFVVNTLLSAMKLTVGLIGKSGALVADGVHSLSDLATDIIVYVSIRITGKPADARHNYGHGKVENIATVIVSIALFIAGFSIGREGIENIVSFTRGNPIEVPGISVLIAAGVSLIIKEILFRYTIGVGKSIGSDVLVANAWHQRSDALSSLGVLLGAGGAYLLGADFAFLDPVAQIIVSLFIFRAAYKILTPNIGQLVDASLDEDKIETIKEVLDKNIRVRGYHHLRTRKVGSINAVDVHVLVDSRLGIKEAHDISTELECCLKAYIGDDSIISIHIEPDVEAERL